MKQSSSPLGSPGIIACRDLQADPVGSLIALSARHHIIDEQDEAQRFNMRCLFNVLPSSIADLRTQRAAETSNFSMQLIIRLPGRRSAAFSVALEQDTHQSPGEVIIKEGARESAMYLLISGSVSIFKRIGDIFGEMSRLARIIHESRVPAMQGGGCFAIHGVCEPPDNAAEPATSARLW